MKKIVIGMLALVLCLGMNSCKKEAAPAAEQAPEGTEQVAAAEPQGPSLAEIVEKAKAEGANWSVDEWKEQFKAFALALKPMLVEMDGITKQIEADPSKAADLMKKIEEVKTNYPDAEKLMGEFNKIAEGCANGKAVVDDEEWGQKMMEELGVPKL